MNDSETAPPAFDDTRAALEFALNASRVEMPRPFMNKAMAEAVKKTAKRRKKSTRELTEAEQLLEQENAVKPRKSRPPGPPPLKGLDRAHLAGYILSQLERLDRYHKTILKGLMIHAYDPCACRSPCCSGWRRNARWAEAVKDTCLMLKETADITKTGKRGLSTQPELRMAFVEQFYTKNTMTVAAAAAKAQVTTMTATRHRDWIFEWLEQQEDEAWQALDRVFDRSGITGAFL